MTAPPPPASGPSPFSVPQVPGSPSASAPTDASPIAKPEVFPQLWTQDDLPGLPWCISKGVAKAIVLVFFSVLVPLELFFTAFANTGLPVSHPWSQSLLIYGGGALAITSGGFTATQTTRLKGLFWVLNRTIAVVYIYILATLAIITVGPLSFGGGNGGGNSGSATVTLHFGFVELLFLFMIPPAIATVAWAVTLYEDYKHPGERLPWDYPLRRRERKRRERAIAEAWGIPPPP